MQMWVQRRLSLLGFALAGILLLVVGWLSYAQMQRLERARELAANTLILREETEIVVSQVTDAETGQRGYLLTGDSSYLDPYEAVRRDLGPRLAKLRQLFAGDLAQRDRVARLEALVDRKLAELAQTIDLRRRMGYEAAVQVVMTHTGQRLMEEIREVAAAMRAEDARVYAEREAALEREARIATAVNVGGLVTAFLLVVGATALALRAGQQSEAERVARQLSEAAASASAESEARLRITLESIGDAVIAIDDRGHVTMMNPVAQALTGWTEADAQGRAFGDVFTIIDEATRGPVENPATRVRREGAVVGLINHTLLLTRDGREIPIDDSAAPIRIPGDRMRGVVVVFRDVTVRRELERRRIAVLEAEQAARRAAEAASRAKDEFVATLSHELRTPLNSIFGWARMLQERTLDADTTRRAVEVIERNTRSQLQLIDDLLDVSRIVAGKLRLESRPVEVSAVVEAAIDTVRPTAEAKHVALAVRSDPGPTIVAGDADRLQQVFWNLLSNAIRFTPAGGRVEVHLRRADGHAEIQVADSGVGIEPEFLPHVFERFRQANESAARTHRGLGLGLALVRHLVELHGGTVQAHSEGSGRGATFTVRLPMQPTSASGRAAGQGDNAPPGRLSGLRILVVDDDTDSRDLARIVCEQGGASVVSAESAAAALRALDTGPVDVLVTDIGMPGADGYELLAAVRSRPDGGRIPAIALTAYARLEDRERALNAGFRLHVPKPVDPARLARAVALVAGRESAF